MNNQTIVIQLSKCQEEAFETPENAFDPTPGWEIKEGFLEEVLFKCDLRRVGFRR